MAPPRGLNDITWDGAVGFIAFGTTRVPLLKYNAPKVSTKVSKIRRIGEMRATKRTPGVTDVADLTVELLASDYASLILPRLPRHGGTLITFQAVANLRHPGVIGSYSTMCESCRIIGNEGPTIENSEKEVIKKLDLSVMQLWEKGGDGIWKCQSLEPTLPNSEAFALIEF